MCRRQQRGEAEDARAGAGDHSRAAHRRARAALAAVRVPRGRDARARQLSGDDAALRAAGVPYIVDGASDAQARAAEALFQLRDKELDHLESSEGVNGGWADAEDAREFEMLMARHVMGLSWCCTSWYKPSGPSPTLSRLPLSCYAAGAARMR